MWRLGLEHFLNTLLARDPAAPARLSRLAGSRLLFRLVRPRVDALLGVTPEGISLTFGAPHENDRLDTEVELDERTLRELLAGRSIEELMFSGSLTVRGDIMRLEAVRDLLLDLDIDWEGQLARWMGHGPAHSVAEGLRCLVRIEHRARREFSADFCDYLREEVRLLPGRRQAAVVRDHLTELETTLDRLNARVERVQQRLDRQRGVT